MNGPEVSTVIPCYNAARYVVTAVQSALAQDVENEVIVVDDGSGDDSIRVLAESRLPVRLIQQANHGVAAARNAGIRVARGRYVAFLDADDVWLPRKLQTQLHLLRNAPEARMAYSAWRTWPSEDAVPPAALLADLEHERAHPERWQGASGWIYTQLLRECVVWTSTVIVERTLLEQVGAFDTALRIGEDYDLWLRLSRQTQILRVPAPLALYRLHPSSTTRVAPDRNWQAEVLDRALHRWGYVGPDGQHADRRLIDIGIAQSWATIAGMQFEAGRSHRARQSALKAIGLYWREARAWKVLARSLLP